MRQVVSKFSLAHKAVNAIKFRFQFHSQNARNLAISAQTQSQTQGQDDSKLWVHSFYPKVPIPEGVALHEYLRSNVKSWGNLTAYECGVSGRKYTHNQVYAMSRGFAAALLQSKKFQRGDVIGVVSQNTPEYAAVVLGILEAGLIASPANPAYTNEEIARQLKGAGAKAAVTSPEFVSVVRAIRNTKECPSLQTVIVTGDAPEGCHSFFEMAKVDPTGLDFLTGANCNTKEQTCLLPYSSGTTGNPKGVELTHFNMVANSLQVGAPSVSNIKPTMEGERQERILGVLPYFHIYGLMTFVIQNMYKGLHTLTLPKFQPELFIKAIRSHKPTAMHLVPPLLHFVAATPELSKDDLSELTTTVVGGAPTGEHIAQMFLNKTRKDLCFQHGYGMTEVSSGCHILGPNCDQTKVASCGGLMPNTMGRIVDVATGKTLGRNERGEIWMKGPQVMKGYFKNEKATRECLDEDGWLRSGDIGYYDNEGYIFIVDRLKELIKVKGFQVAPSELEELLREHPDIADVAVFGVPDDAAGELPRASIIRRNKSLSEEDVNKFMKDRVIGYKQLRGGVEFVESIPKAPSGKILRRELLRIYKEQKRS